MLVLGRDSVAGFSVLLNPTNLCVELSVKHPPVSNYRGFYFDAVCVYIRIDRGKQETCALLHQQNT